jgi:hypothetical protein
LRTIRAFSKVDCCHFLSFGRMEKLKRVTDIF